jgi:hypothetical protein
MYKWLFAALLCLSIFSVIIFSYFCYDLGKIINIRIIIITGAIGWAIIFIYVSILWNRAVIKYGWPKEISCDNCLHESEPVCFGCINYQNWEKGNNDSIK